MATTIMAMGGGGFSAEGVATALDRCMLGLAAVEVPRVCFVPTASGDAEGYIDQFYAAFAEVDCSPIHLPLFRRTTDDLGSLVANQDVLYVGGGNTANLLAVWRSHGLAEVLRAEANRRDIVVGGLSAGAMCWFIGGLTDAFGPMLRPITNGLAWVPSSFCPHYDDPTHDRHSAYRAAVLDGSLPKGIACDDGAGVIYRDGDVLECVTESPGAGCYDVRRVADGVVETALPVRAL